MISMKMLSSLCRLTRVSHVLSPRSSTRLFGCQGAPSPAGLLDPLLSAEDLVTKTDDVKFVDASWFLPGVERDTNAEYVEERISGALRFDFDALSDVSSPLPHMLPPVSLFNEWARDNGLLPEQPIVVYTSKDSFSSPRVWWTFKVFGHHNVSILNGGLEAWKKAGGAIESGAPTPPPSRTDYTSPGMNKRLVVDSEQVMKVMTTGSAQICDARPAPRFEGAVDEPRPGLARGHIPGSLNVPFGGLLAEDDKTTFIPPINIRAKMTKAGVIPGSKVIMTCGSGVTACTLAFGMVLLGQRIEDVPIYDGSWADWGRPEAEELPKMIVDK